MSMNTKYTAWIWKGSPGPTTPRREHTGMPTEALAKQWITDRMVNWNEATEYGVGHEMLSGFVLDFGSAPVRARAERGEDPRTHWWDM